MSDSVQRVEGEWGSEDCLSSVLHKIRELSDKFDDMGAVKGSWCDEVGYSVAVEHLVPNF